MNHLSVEKIIRFISFTEMNESNMILSSEVNSHMVKCAACRKKVLSITETVDQLTGKKKLRATKLALDDELFFHPDMIYTENK